MKILMIAPQPFFEPRGTPISVFQRLHGLSSLGHEVDLVTYHIGKDVEIPGVSIHRAPRIPGIDKVKIGPSFAKIPLDIVLFLKTIWMLITRRYDVIHSHEEAAFMAVILAALFRLPHIYDMHSSLPQQLAASKFGKYHFLVKIFEILENFVIKTCDVVLTIGSDLEDYVLFINRQANHIRIENIAVHSDTEQQGPTASDLKQKFNLNGALSIVYTGTFERYQGLDILFESLQTVTQQQPHVKLVMVGGKPEQVAQCKDKVANMGLADHVVFTGIVPLDESLQYLELADILASPRSEGLSVPLKIYSYLHSGKPTVATNIVAHTQILNEETAVIVEPNAEAYAHGILRLIENPTLRHKIGQQACAYAQREFSKEGYLSKLERAYLAIKHCKRISEIPIPDYFGQAQSINTV
jgi:glycosyltransferase involved in cell wall biosynthesis